MSPPRTTWLGRTDGSVAFDAICRHNAHYENLPNFWCIVPLGNICGLNEGKPISDKEYHYIDVKGLRTGNYVSKQSGKYVPAGTTLILVDGENSGEVFHTPVEGYQGSTMKVLDIDSEMNAQYVLYFVKFYQKALRENKVGSAIPHLNKKMFRELIIPIPTKEEQERIVGAIQQYYRILDNISANI
ncbi:MAG: restriction endonuclease subunit S [Bacteroidales bacterium]|nr:restriction endonuclease subunit S [Bacteroidales bacterium]MDY6348378.1 restriction endonuclease subunit S [Bacteroidales bacterium]